MGDRLDDRLRAVCDLMVPAVRGRAGRREYDGVVPDLSHEGVTAGLARLGPREDDPVRDPDPGRDAHLRAHLAAFEAHLHTAYGDCALHRRSPRPLLEALGVNAYDADYASPEHRLDARRRHLAAWPGAVEAALPTLDEVAAATAAALLPSARGLDGALDVGVAPEGVDAASDADGERILADARQALQRLVAHLERAAAASEAPVALGGQRLAALLGAGEALPVDLGRLEERADAERDRLRAMLADGCAALAPERPVADVVAGLLGDHPDADGVLRETRALTGEVVAFTRDDGLLDDIDGECRVAPSPPSLRWATAMLSWPGPDQPDGPSWFFVTPPEPSWPVDRQRQWLTAYNRTTLPATTVHEVAPGHFAHGRLLRRVRSDVARILQSPSFVEGWAHYAEELLVERGFRRGDPRYPVGVALKALVRVTRLAASLGVHGGTMTLDEAAARFERDAFLRPAVARAEAQRASHDPTYGRYTWGKLVIAQARQAARRTWGGDFSLRRFHHAMLDLGAPPLGLVASGIGLDIPRVVE